MAYNFTKAWFEMGEWPIEDRKEISHHYPEDIRKMLFIWKYPHAGRRLNTYTPLASNSQWSLGNSKETTGTVRKGSLTYVHFGELWTNSTEWVGSVGSPATISEPPREFHRYVRVTYSGTVYKSKLVHKSSSSFSTDLAAGKWETDAVPNGVVSGTAYYTPGTWQADTEYFENEWITSGGGWVLTSDSNLYHDYDVRQPRTIWYNKHNAWVNEDYSYSPSSLLPRQTDEPANQIPFYFKDIAKFRYNYKDKIGFDASIITAPKMMGAQWSETYVTNNGSAGEDWTRSSPFKQTADSYYMQGGNQYSNGDNLPVGEWNSNPKVESGAYQQMAEVYCDNTKWAVDATYLASWDLEDTANNSGSNQWESDDGFYYPGYDDTNHPFFGCNESSFEFLLKQQDLFDWYWDDETPYIPLAMKIIRGEGVVGIDLADFPLPIGTWRRTWRHSLGRPQRENGEPKLMRAAELGTPSFDTYPGLTRYNTDNPDSGTKFYDFIFPVGTYVSTLPTISDFTNWDTTITGIEDTSTIIINDSTADWSAATDYILAAFTIDADTKRRYKAILASGPSGVGAKQPKDNLLYWELCDEIKIGAVIYIGTGTALSGYKTSGALNWAYVLGIEYEDGSAYIQTDKDCTVFWDAGQKTVCGDTHITERHDPIQIDAINITPTYEIKKELVNELREFMGFFQWQEFTLGLQSRYIISRGWIEDSPANLNPNALQAAINLAWGFPDPDAWYDSGWLSTEADTGNGIYEGLATGSGISNIEELTIASLTYNKSAGTYSWSNPGGDYSCRVSAFACRPSDNDDDLFKNIKSVIGKVSYKDMVDPFFEAYEGDFSIAYYHIAQSTGYGIVASVLAEGATAVTKTKDIQIPTSGSWIEFYPGVGPGPMLSEYFDSTSVTIWDYGSLATIDVSSLDTDSIAIQLDYDRIPKSVFLRSTAIDSILTHRDNFGFIIWPTNLFGTDEQAPLPLNGANWAKEPYAEFEYHYQFDDESDSNYSSITSIATATDIITYTNTHDGGSFQAFAEGTIVELVQDSGSVVPAGLSYVKVYKITNISGQTAKLQYLSDGVESIVDITDSGTGTSYIRLASYYELQIKASIGIGEDEEQSDPVEYRMVATTGSGAITTTYQEAQDFVIEENRYSEYEAEQNGGLSISSTSVTGSSPNYSHAFAVDNSSGYIETGDGIDIEEDVAEVDRLYSDGMTTIATTDGTTVTVNAGDEAAGGGSDTEYLHLEDESGYVWPQYYEESCRDYLYKPQLKDSATVANEGKLGKEADVDDLTTYPYEL